MKFENEFINEVKSYWKKNKGKELYMTKTNGYNKSSYNYQKKFGMSDLAEHFKITYAQASRLIYRK